MSTDPIIRIENLGKQYRLGHTIDLKRTFRETLADLPRFLGRRGVTAARRLVGPTEPNEREISRDETFWALRELNLEVCAGDVIGIIGRNGAGKSTLLKILSRITEPTTGYAEIHGRMASLLEVGTGFHPELTGRENIFLNGTILGMKKVEIAAKFDEIVAFADIERFLDTPVKRYSSGMYVRLAFAVAAHLEPEILIVDEVLSVGDAEFQRRCLGKMSAVARGGRTVFFVSHNMGSVAKLCSKALWLDAGRARGCGETSEIIARYLSEAYASSGFIAYSRRSNGPGQIVQVRLLNDDETVTSNFPTGKEPTVEVKIHLDERVTGAHLACIVTSLDGLHLFSTADTDLSPERFGPREPGEYTFRFKLPISDFNMGTYSLAFGLGIPGREVFDRQEALTVNLVDTGDFGSLKEGKRREGLLLTQVPWHCVEVPSRV